MQIFAFHKIIELLFVTNRFCNSCQKKKCKQTLKILPSFTFPWRNGDRKIYWKLFTWSFASIDFDEIYFPDFLFRNLLFQVEVVFKFNALFTSTETHKSDSLNYFKRNNVILSGFIVFCKLLCDKIEKVFTETSSIKWYWFICYFSVSCASVTTPKLSFGNLSSFYFLRFHIIKITHHFPMIPLSNPKIPWGNSVMRKRSKTATNSIVVRSVLRSILDDLERIKNRKIRFQIKGTWQNKSRRSERNGQPIVLWLPRRESFFTKKVHDSLGLLSKKSKLFPFISSRWRREKRRKKSEDENVKLCRRTFAKREKTFSDQWTKDWNSPVSI